MKKTAFLLLAAGLCLLMGCASAPGILDGDGMVNSYHQISQDEAREMLARDDGHILVDVRRQDEYDAGHIPGAVCIPNESIGGEAPPSLPDREQIILVYCRSGRRSKEAAQKLFDLGYTQVYEFGGILDWTGEIVTDAAASAPALVIEANGSVFRAVLAETAAAEAFAEKLRAGALALELADYGHFEKVGPLPWELPREDGSLTTRPGDVLLYQGNQITIYYDANTWSFTRLGTIDGVTREELLDAFGDGGVTVTFRLEESE